MANYLRHNLKEEPEFYFGQGFFDSREEIIKEAAGCDIVGISATTPVFPEATRIAEGIKKENPSVKTVLGGYMPSALPEWCADWKCWTHVVVGEGENAMLRICQGEAKTRIVLSQNVHPLDEIPPADRHLIRNERTIALTEKNDNERITSTLTQRGCPFSCRFCADGSGPPREIDGAGRVGHSMWGMGVRYHSDQRVADEIKHVSQEWNLDFLKFSDMTTNSNKERLKRICRLLVKEDGLGNCQLGSNMHASKYLVDEELLSLMQKAGWREVWFGVEAATDRLLSTLGKSLKIEDVKRAFKLAKKAGLKTRAYFQIGHWAETSEDIKAIPELVHEIEPDIFGCTITCPYPATSCWLELTPEERERFLQWDFLEKMDEYDNPIRHTPAMSNEQLKWWQQWLTEQCKMESQLVWRQSKGMEGRQEKLAYMEV